jgi:hypothetical protein
MAGRRAAGGIGKLVSHEGCGEARLAVGLMGKSRSSFFKTRSITQATSRREAWRCRTGVVLDGRRQGRGSMVRRWERQSFDDIRGTSGGRKRQKERGEEGENNGHPSSLGKPAQLRWRDLSGEADGFREKRTIFSLSQKAETLKKKKKRLTL